MTSAGRASLFLGAGTVVQVVCGLALAKVLALYTGVEGVGLQGLLLAIGSLAVLAGGLGVGSAIVRALGTQGPEVRARLSAATATWFRLAGPGVGVVVFGLILVVGMDGLGLGSLPWMQGVPLCLGVACALIQLGDVAVLSAHQASSTIATSMAAGAIVGAGIGGALVLEFGYGAIPTTYLATQAAASLTAYAGRRRVVGALAFSPVSAAKDLRALIGHGLPIALSTAVGSGVQVIMPLLIQPIDGLRSVGLFRAVTAITGGAVGVMTIALARDYYPRVAASSLQNLVDLPRQQQRILLAGSLPLVMIGTMFASLALRILYSPQFAGASTFFGLQLVGQVMRLTSFTFAFILLARAGRGTYLALEAATGALLLVLGVTGLRLFGLNGLGAAYLVTSSAYLIATSEICRRRFAIRPNLGMMGALAIVAAGGLLLLPDWSPLTHTAVALTATGAAALLIGRSKPSSRRVALGKGVE